MSGRVPKFGPARRAGYTDIAGLECQAGAKKARVTFINDRNFVDHLQLFGATSMMPAHVLSDRLGYGVTEAIQAVDPVRIAEIAEASVAISHEAIASSIFNTVHAHPTLSEAVMEAMGDALGRAIHI